MAIKAIRDIKATSMPGRACVPTTLAFAVGLLTIATPARAENWSISWLTDLRLTYTDNVHQTQPKQGSTVFEIMPGVRIYGRGPRASLDLSYQANQVYRTHGRPEDELRNALSATGSVEAIENWFFIDGRAQITQQATSAFGPQFVSNASASENRTETRIYILSPYVRGRLGDTGEYEFRHTSTLTDTDRHRSALRIDRISDWTGVVQDTRAFGNLGWGLSYASRSVQYDGLNDLENEYWKASLFYQATDQLKLSAYVGTEDNNYTFSSRSESIRGVAAEWLPTVRSTVTAHWEHRFFGSGYGLALLHRRPASSWSLAYTKALNSIPEFLGGRGQGTWYDLVFFNLASAFPDPVARAAETDRLLQQLGIPADTPTGAGLLTSEIFNERRLEGSFALIGRRNAVTFSGFRSNRNATLGAFVGFSDDLTVFREITQRGVSANWSHRLGALTSFGMLAAWVRSTGLAAATAESTQKTVSVSLTRRLSRTASGSLALRTIDFDSSGAGFRAYRENAITATLSMRF